MAQELEWHFLCRDALLIAKIVSIQRHMILMAEKNLPGCSCISSTKAARRSPSSLNVWSRVLEAAASAISAEEKKAATTTSAKRPKI